MKKLIFLFIFSVIICNITSVEIKKEDNLYSLICNRIDNYPQCSISTTFKGSAKISLEEMIKKLKENDDYNLHFDEIDLNAIQKNAFTNSISNLFTILKSISYSFTGYIPNHSNEFKLNDFLKMFNSNKSIILDLQFIPIEIDSLDFIYYKTNLKWEKIFEKCHVIKEIFQHHFKYPSHIIMLSFFFKGNNTIPSLTSANITTLLSFIQSNKYDNLKDMKNPFTLQNTSIKFQIPNKINK